MSICWLVVLLFMMSNCFLVKYWFVFLFILVGFVFGIELVIIVK